MKTITILFLWLFAMQPLFAQQTTKILKKGENQLAVDKEGFTYRKGFYAILAKESKNIIWQDVVVVTDSAGPENKRFSYKYGVESALLSTGDYLIIKHSGYSHITIDYNFILPRETHDIKDVIYWYKKAIALLQLLDEGKNEDIQWVIQTLTSGMKKSDPLDLNIYFGEYTKVKLLEVVKNVRETGVQLTINVDTTL